MAVGVPLSKKFLAELIGTFWLVLGGCGSAVLAAVFPYDSPAANPLGLGFLGVSIAFGLTLLTMAYAIGHISGPDQQQSTASPWPPANKTLG